MGTVRQATVCHLNSAIVFRGRSILSPRHLQLLLRSRKLLVRRQVDDHQVEQILKTYISKTVINVGDYEETYALHLPSLFSSVALLPSLSASSGWITVFLAFSGWLDLASGEQREPGALEGRMARVGDSSCEIRSLVCWDC